MVAVCVAATGHTHTYGGLQTAAFGVRLAGMRRGLRFADRRRRRALKIYLWEEEGKVDDARSELIAGSVRGASEERREARARLPGLD